MPEPRDAFLARRREELFADLHATRDLLERYQEEHNKTPYRCMRSGACCQVGLQLHMMECEDIARRIERETAGDPAARRAAIRKLKRALTDPTWNWGSAIGDHMCAFYDDGCTIYPDRPAICRMYGVVLEVDDFCPRERLSDQRAFVYVQPDVDRLIARYYRALDTYGRLHPERDHTVYMPVGVLSFLISKTEMKDLRKRTRPTFWKRERGYRAQFVPSYRRGASLRTNVAFPFALPKG